MDVEVTRDGAVATLTLARPERRNALSEELLTRLTEVCAALRDDTGTHVVVLTGAAPVFCAGADAGLRSSMSVDEQRAAFQQNARSSFLPLFVRVLESLEALPQATIAMVNGHAVGAGWALTLACDFRVAARAAQFWIPEVDLGIPLATPMTARFLRLAGPVRTKEITMTGRRYSAEEARDLGLVTRVTPGAELAGAVREHAALLAGKPFPALAQMKARVDRLIALPKPEGLS